MKKRRTNRAKVVSWQCRNNGTCDWCTGNRLYSSRKYDNYEKEMEEEMQAIKFEEDIPLCIEWQGNPCVIIDVVWMDRDILTVPVPERVKIVWEEADTLFTAWVEVNEIKQIKEIQ